MMKDTSAQMAAVQVGNVTRNDLTSQVSHLTKSIKLHKLFESDH